MAAETVGAIIAASAALLGVIVSQAFSFLQKSSEMKHQQRVLLRTKFEEVSLNIAESVQWLAALHNANSWQELIAQSQSQPAKKAIALCQLYFPELVEPVNRYILAQCSCYRHAVECYSVQKTGNAGAVAMMSPQYKILIDELFAAKNALETIIAAHAGVYSR